MYMYYSVSDTGIHCKSLRNKKSDLYQQESNLWPSDNYIVQ